MMTYVFLLVVLYLCATAEGLSYMQVYVNRIQLPHISFTEKQKSVTYSYYYVNGDMADVWCLKMQSSCSLHLNYEFYNESIGGNGHITAKTTARDTLLGLRTTLRAEHHEKRVVCVCYDHLTKYTIIVKLLQAVPNRSLFLKGLNTTILYDQLEVTSDRPDISFTVQFAYKRDENINFTCGTTDRDVRILICGNNDGRAACKQDTKINVRPDVDGKMIRFEASKNGAIVRSVKVFFINVLSALLSDEIPLNVNMDNVLLELYEQKGDRIIYYDYIDGETPKITCTTSQDVIYMHSNASLVLNDTVSKPGESYVEKQVRFRPDHNRTIINCDLYDGNKNALRHAEVLLRLKTGQSIPLQNKPVVVIAQGSNIQIDYGASQTLTCRVTAYPAPTITWKNSHRKLLLSQNTPVKVLGNEFESNFTIEFASNSDTYSCSATNNKGNQVKSIYVDVRNPFVIISTLQDQTSLKYGVNSTLICDISSSSPYHISWYHNGKEIDTNLPVMSDKFKISRDGKTLSINVINLDIQGKYSCIARLDNDDKSVTYNTEVHIDGLKIEDQKWIIAAASGVACIVIVVVVATVCFLKRSKLPAQTRPDVDDAPIPLYPPQWDTTDVVPVDQILEDPTYSETWTLKAEANTSAGSKTQRDETENELTYADLDIASLNRVHNSQAPKRFILDDTPYAEVMPDYVRLREN